MTSRPVTPRAVLVVVGGDAAGRPFELHRNLCVVGRDNDTDLRVADVAVSRHHLLLVVDPDGTVSVRDLGSSNGTRVNGQWLTAERKLLDGDEISIGANTVLRFAAGPRTP